ncbi:TetR/AcrR family transcriptional regulator [Oceaniserpentilla sp. 4NH20-0058]|uniref:TetR/AcrR family transcriptional regulator n=1 Tax=Oceaniserpentilla sp. 4NH20-0058 TaxID=3127660 RepID=UPI00333FA534
MISDLNYSNYAKRFPLSQEDIIDHLIAKYHSGISVKQASFIKHNLTLILEATFKLSRKMSFSKMTVRDLQKETGISMGSLYNCFGSKERLESMIIEGVSFIAHSSSQRGITLDLDHEQRLILTIRIYIYLGRIFKPWYYFIAMEFRTMTEENFERVVDVRLSFLNDLAVYMKGNLAISSHVSTIIQDFNIRDWKYAHVDIDDFADHCVRLAKILNTNSVELGDLSIDNSGF